MLLKYPVVMVKSGKASLPSGVKQTGYGSWPPVGMEYPMLCEVALPSASVKSPGWSRAVVVSRSSAGDGGSAVPPGAAWALTGVSASETHNAEVMAIRVNMNVSNPSLEVKS